MSTTRKASVALLTGVVALALIGGCQTSPSARPPRPGEQPVWVNDPEGAFPGDKGKVIYAVGLSADTRNRAMTMDRAKANGRDELARVLRVNAQSMIKDWMASSTDFVDPKSTTSKQFTETVSRQVTNTLLVGSRTVKSWQDPKSKTLYMLMSLSHDDFIKQLSEQSDKALRQMGSKLLKVSPDQAMESLDDFVQKAREQMQQAPPPPPAPPQAAQAPKPSAQAAPVPKPAPKAAPPKPVAPSAGVPAWVTTSPASHPDYPAADFLLAVGVRTMGRDDSLSDALAAAQTQALAELAKQVRVQVSQKYRDVVRAETTKTSDGQAVKKTGSVQTITNIVTETEVDLRVEAGKQAGHYYDMPSRTHYCLAVADRAKWAKELARTINAKRVESQKYHDEASRASTDAQFMLAMRNCFRALNELVALLKDESVWTVVAPKTGAPALSAPRPGFRAADVIIMLDRLIDGLKMEAAGGDKQRGSFARPLPKPLAVRLYCQVAGKQGPGDKTLIRFALKGIDPAKIDIQPEATTNDKGRAECYVKRTDKTGKAVHQIEAVPDLEAIFPKASALPMPKVTFTYFLPTIQTTRVAVKIIEAAEGKARKPSWLESKITEALRKTGLQVIDESELAKKAPGADKLHQADEQQIVAALRNIADVAVVGTLSLDFLGDVPYGPMTMKRYQARRTVRAIDLATGEVLLSVDESGQNEKGLGPTKDRALRDALRRMGDPGKPVAEAILRFLQGPGE